MITLFAQENLYGVFLSMITHFLSIYYRRLTFTHRFYFAV